MVRYYTVVFAVDDKGIAIQIKKIFDDYGIAIQMEDTFNDEDIAIQMEETLKLFCGSIQLFLLKDGCDKLPTGNGKFGSLTNPIPVNGDIGTFAYLNRLRTMDNVRFRYIRNGSYISPATKTCVRAYEISSMDGKIVKKLYFDRFNFWRSIKTPHGLKLAPYAELTENELECLKTDFGLSIPILVNKKWGFDV